MTREIFKLRQRPLVTCPKCEGKGWYDYHWQECGNSQIDEWVKEDCRQCNKTGKIEKPVVRVKANKESERLVPMADVNLLIESLCLAAGRLEGLGYEDAGYLALKAVKDFRAKYKQET